MPANLVHGRGVCFKTCSGSLFVSLGTPLIHQSWTASSVPCKCRKVTQWVPWDLDVKGHLEAVSAEDLGVCFAEHEDSDKTEPLNVTCKIQSLLSSGVFKQENQEKEAQEGGGWTCREPGKKRKLEAAQISTHTVFAKVTGKQGSNFQEVSRPHKKQTLHVQGQREAVTDTTADSSEKKEHTHKKKRKKKKRTGWISKNTGEAEREDRKCEKVQRGKCERGGRCRSRKEKAFKEEEEASEERAADHSKRRIPVSRKCT